MVDLDIFNQYWLLIVTVTGGVGGGLYWVWRNFEIGAYLKSQQAAGQEIRKLRAELERNEIQFDHSLEEVQVNARLQAQATQQLENTRAQERLYSTLDKTLDYLLTDAKDNDTASLRNQIELKEKIDNLTAIVERLRIDIAAMATIVRRWPND